MRLLYLMYGSKRRSNNVTDYFVLWLSDSQQWELFNVLWFSFCTIVTLLWEVTVFSSVSLQTDSCEDQAHCASYPLLLTGYWEGNCRYWETWCVRGVVSFISSLRLSSGRYLGASLLKKSEAEATFKRSAVIRSRNNIAGLQLALPQMVIMLCQHCATGLGILAGTGLL